MAPENGWLEYDELSFWGETAYFQVRTVSFREGKQKKIQISETKLGFACLMLGKRKKYFTKSWFNGDLSWWKVHNHVKQTKDDRKYKSLKLRQHLNMSPHKEEDIHLQTITSWWFQPIPKILVKLDHFPTVGLKIKQV